MKYILSNSYALRGFDNGKTEALIELDTGKRQYPDDGMMLLLEMCDGKTDSDVFSFFPGMRQGLDKALEKGWIRVAEAGERLRPEQVYCKLPVPDIFFVQWSITGKCNANCRHCFITDHQHTQTDLTTEEMLRVIDRLADACVYSVALTGGEPLVRKDLPVLLKAMCERHIKVTALSTNGFLFDDNMLDLFLKYGMRPDVQISFDGIGNHDWMRRVPGAEKMAIAAMECCKKRDFPFALAMCLHRGNSGLMDSTVKLGMEKGAHLIRFSPVSGFGGFNPEKGINLLNIEEIYRLYLDYLSVVLEEKPGIDIEFQGILRINGREPGKAILYPYTHSCMDPEKNRVCTSVDHAFYLTDDGRVMPCISIAGNGVEGDCLKLSDHSLEECLNGPFYREFLKLNARDILTKNPECAGCEHLKYCGCGCRGASLIYEDHLYGVDRDKCLFYRNGWGEKLKKILSAYSGGDAVGGRQ